MSPEREREREREEWATLLLKGYRNGEKGRTSPYFDLLHSRLSKLLVHKFQIPPGDAEEIAAKCLEDLWINRSRIEDPGKAWKYLLSAGFRLTQKWIKEKRAEEPLFNGIQDPTSTEKEKDRDFFESFIPFWQGLDQELREILLMKLEGANLCEISRSLNVSTSTVKRRIRLLKNLGGLLFLQ